jgi:preprotein translocase subunit YajC
MTKNKKLEKGTKITTNGGTKGVIKSYLGADEYLCEMTSRNGHYVTQISIDNIKK